MPAINKSNNTSDSLRIFRYFGILYLVDW